MRKKPIRVIAIILLMAFILFAAFVPVLINCVVPDNYVFYVFMNMVFLMLLGICFFPFTKVILSTHKLE